jgi:diacylglycerol kinase family enzyme
LKLALVVKPSGTHRHRLRDEIAELEQGFPAADIRIIESGFPGESIELARAAAADADCIIAVGGDGTLNEVVNGCLQAATENPSRISPQIAALAYGTANDFIKSTPLTGRVDQLVCLLAGGRSRAIDVGRIRFRDLQGREAVRYFINEASVGITADIVRHINRGRRSRTSFRYLGAVPLAFRRFGVQRALLSWDTGPAHKQELLALIAANGRYFGSGLCIAPQAKLDDARLSCTVVGDVGAGAFVRYLRRLKRGVPIQHPLLYYRDARGIEIGKRDRAAPVEADGEFLGYTPATIDILPGKIRFLM